MTNLIVRDPFEFVGGLNRVFDRFMQEPIFSGMTNGHNDAQGGGRGVAPLALDIVESPSDVMVRASLPGFRREDVNVEIHDRILTISATRQEDKEESNQTFHLRERRVGSVARRVELPESVQGEAASAELKDGVLTLRFPKAAASMKRQIEIK